MHRVPLVLALILLAPPVSAFVLVEFCPDPYLEKDLDEYFVLEGSGPLDGIVVSDGEGSLRFPPGSHLSGRCVVARDAEAYRRSHGALPDYEWEGSSPLVPDMERTGRFQLANTRDEITLFWNRDPVQKVEWPGTVSTRQGQVHYLEDGTWDRRILMLGQSRFAPATFDGVSGVAFVAPDCSREVFLSAVGGAREDILVAVYEFTSPDLARALVEAAGRGVNVTVLLEGGPVGGIPAGEKWVISRLEGAGIPVSAMSGTQDVHAPYRFMHAKYMVVDRSGVLVTSENFKDSGFPERGKKGNRGWGVFVRDRRLAEYFASVFSHDAGGKYTVRAPAGGGTMEIAHADASPPRYTPYDFSGATVTPVVSPDTSYLLHELLRGAERTLDIEVAYIANESAGVLNPLLSDAVDAARRGVRVRVLLDSYPYNVEDEADNDEMADLVNRIAASEGLPLEARIADLSRGNILKVHNKGAIVDGRKVLVSSVNWNSNSPAFNREAALIVDHPGVGAYFSEVFESDWRSAGGEGEPGYRPDMAKVAAAVAVVVLIACVIILKRRRRR